MSVPTAGHPALQVPFMDLRAQHDEVRDEINVAIARAIDGSAFIGGPAIGSFERAFAGFCGVPYAGVGSGTDALRLALEAGVRSGEGVSLPRFPHMTDQRSDYVVHRVCSS